MAEAILVALGGNALVRPGQQGTIAEQMANLNESLSGIVELIRRGHGLVVTHGNGPQVGHILIRAEEARDKAYDLPLDVCVAQSQGEIGYLIQQSLQNHLRLRQLDRPVVSLISLTVVDKHDVRMTKPTKPVGPFYSMEQAVALRQRGYHLMEDARRGYRRVVPSPLPLRIVETEVIRQLVGEGVIVIAVGGGGVPVWVDEDGRMEGVEAVVDKDLASSVLAVALGIKQIVDLTSVEHVKLHFGTQAERDLDKLTVDEARAYLKEGHFAPGSMGPKIEAAIHFLSNGGRRVIISSPTKALEAFDGRTGTQLYPG